MITLNRSRVMVTGGAGFLGSHVVEELRRRGAIVSVPNHGDYDLCDNNDARRAFAKANADLVVHCAALCGGIGANRARPADFCRDNLLMGINVLSEVERRGIEKVVMIGTTCSYPRDAQAPFREDSLWTGYPEPTNAPYGVAKLALITLAQAYRDQFNTNAVTVIPTNLYGPGDNFSDSGHVIPHMTRAFCNGGDVVKLWGTGAPTRDFLYVADAARGIVDALAMYDEREPVNLGTGDEISICHLALKIASACGYEGKIEWDESMPDGQQRRRMDSSRARERIGFVPQTSLDDGIAATVEWYREHECER